MDMRKIGPPPLGSQVTARLLDLLSTDDNFRNLFVQDVFQALTVAGYVQPEGASQHPGFCFLVKQLAPKEDIARDRQKLERSLNSIQDFLCPIELRAGN